LVACGLRLEKKKKEKKILSKDCSQPWLAGNLRDRKKNCSAHSSLRHAVDADPFVSSAGPLQITASRS